MCCVYCACYTHLTVYNMLVPAFYTSFAVNFPHARGDIMSLAGTSVGQSIHLSQNHVSCISPLSDFHT